MTSTRFTDKCHLRAALNLEAGPIRCIGSLKSSLVIGQKAEIGLNPFTSRGRADLVILPKPYLLLLATCDEILSWIIEIWIKKIS
jgi:hypothetical protein